jgi:polysaccharide pyruvyl transferase WcaK-like protein
MNIGLLNWSGHHNIGDDVMSDVIQKALEKRGYTVVNQGENPSETNIDAYFWGGGTLITHDGVFPKLPNRPVIGFGLGVYEGTEACYKEEEWRNVKHVFARDIYSYLWFVKHNIPATLSFDPVFLLDLPKLDYERKDVAVNIIASHKVDYAEVKEKLSKYKKEEKIGFAVGLPEDIAGCDDFKLERNFYSNPNTLHEFLSKVRVAITTRLHATIFAYLADVPVIDPIIYDPKITRFWEYVVDNKISPKYMRERLNEHIDYALTMLSNTR